MKHVTQRALRALLAAVIGMAMLSGCGGGTQAPQNTTTQTQTNSTAQTREDLVVVMPEDLETFDPIGTSAMATQATLKLIYARLYYEDENTQPVAWLANSFDTISDTEIQIGIKPGFVFEDGTPITAEDVAYSLNRAHTSPIFSTLMASVERFEAVDDSTLRIVTTGPAPSIKMALAHAGTGILPKTYLEQVEASGDWSAPVCSGPYKVGRRTVGESVQLIKNEQFADAGTAAQNNSLTLKYVPEASTRTIMVETGEADVNFSFATADYQRAKDNADLSIHENTGMTVQYIGVDTTMAPFDNKLVRQALGYAIKREDVLEVVAEGLGVPAYSVLPPSTPGYLENPSNYSYDPEKAKALLAEAGYENGFDTKLIAFNDNGKRIAEIVQMFLSAVGINAEIETYDASVRLTMISNHQVPMFAGAWGALADADLVLPRLFTQEAIGAMNFTSYTNPALDTLFAAARATYDEAERIASYEQAVTILADEAPWTPLYIPQVLCLTRANLQGVVISGESIINMQLLHY